MTTDAYNPSQAPQEDEPIHIDCEGQRTKKWRTIRKTKRERYNPNKKAVRREEN